MTSTMIMIMFLNRLVRDRCSIVDTTEIRNTRINVWLRQELKESQSVFVRVSSPNLSGGLNLHISGPGLSQVSLALLCQTDGA